MIILFEGSVLLAQESEQAQNTKFSISTKLTRSITFLDLKKNDGYYASQHTNFGNGISVLCQYDYSKRLNFGLSAQYMLFSFSIESSEYPSVNIKNGQHNAFSFKNEQ